MGKYIGAAIGSLLGIAANSGEALCQTVEEFYKGRQLEFITSSGPGTSYDTWARHLAKYMGKHLPGNPTFVVKHMPGGGHILGSNHLYARAPQDGSTIGMISQNIPVSALLKNKPGLEIADFNAFSWIGSSDKTEVVCLARGGATVQKAEQLHETEMLVGGSGAGSQVSSIPTFLAATLDLKLKLIEGYKSSAEVLLAMERTEVDGICMTYNGVQRARPGALKDGRLRLLFSLTEETLPGEGVPTGYTLAKTEEQRQMLTFFILTTAIGRPVITPPNTPKDRVEALRKAFEASFKDPQFLEEAAKLNLEPSPTTAAELENQYRRLSAVPQSVRDKVARFIGE